jgi:hypothetical protein
LVKELIYGGSKMQLQVDKSLIQVGLAAIHETLGRKINQNQSCPHHQAMSIDILGILSWQVLIPILVSLASNAIYDSLKGKVLSKLNPKETKKIIVDFHQCTINTNALLSEECMKALLDELSPIGFNEDDILKMYKRAKDAIEKHSKLTMDNKNVMQNDLKDTKKHTNNI